MAKSAFIPHFKTPGIYIDELPKLPITIASVTTDIPAFIGYTQKAKSTEDNDLQYVPRRISSLQEYEMHYGFAMPEQGIEITIDTTQNGAIAVQGYIRPEERSKFLMYYALQMFFANGGGSCYIVSVGDYETGGAQIMYENLLKGLDDVEKVNEVTLLVFPDGINMHDATQYYSLHQHAMKQCAKLRNRFVVLDVFRAPENGDDWEADIAFLRTSLAGTTEELKYAAAYFPRICTTVDFNYSNPETGEALEENVKIISKGREDLGDNLAALKTNNNALYFRAKAAINDMAMLLPASAAVVGVYAQVDRSRGVWKAPANVNVSWAVRPEILLSRTQQEFLNADAITGKSINAIRSFPGRASTMIWGARTLAGNDNEWRYIPVRRFVNMVEASIKNAVDKFAFEPNNGSTWIRVKAMIKDYLTQQWKAGALRGSTTTNAFFVKVGMGDTMTALDIQEGRMVVMVGLAVLRPAEFIVIRLIHKMPQEA